MPSPRACTAAACRFCGGGSPWLSRRGMRPAIPRVATFAWVTVLFNLAVILWGAGSYTQRLLSATRLGECNIVAIVDNDSNKHGLSLHSVTIRAPEAIRDTPGTLLISAAIYAQEIRRDIEALGLPHPIDVLG